MEDEREKRIREQLKQIAQSSFPTKPNTPIPSPTPTPGDPNRLNFLRKKAEEAEMENPEVQLMRAKEDYDAARVGRDDNAFNEAKQRYENLRKQLGY